MNNYQNNQPINGGVFRGMNNAFQGRQPNLTSNTLLTTEEMNLLQRDNSKFNLFVSEMDYTKAKCVHRDKSGNITLENVEDGYVRCGICNKKFKMHTLNDTEKIKETLDNFTGLCETIKLAYVDIPYEYGNYFQFLPLTEKLYELAKIAERSFERFSSANGVNNYNVNNNITARYNNIMGGHYPYSQYQYNNGYQNQFQGNPYPQQGFQQNNYEQNSVNNNQLPNGFNGNNNNNVATDVNGNKIVTDNVTGNQINK